PVKQAPPTVPGLLATLNVLLGGKLVRVGRVVLTVMVRAGEEAVEKLFEPSSSKATSVKEPAANTCVQVQGVPGVVEIPVMSQMEAARLQLPSDCRQTRMCVPLPVFVPPSVGEVLLVMAGKAFM